MGHFDIRESLSPRERRVRQLAPCATAVLALADGKQYASLECTTRITPLGAFMHKRMTITLDEVVYDGLYRTIGKRRMSQFIEDLLRPHVLDTCLDDGYRAMAEDTARESEAHEWCNALAKDMHSETR